MRSYVPGNALLGSYNTGYAIIHPLHSSSSLSLSRIKLVLFLFFLCILYKPVSAAYRMTLHMYVCKIYKHITHLYAFQSGTSAFVERARKKKKEGSGWLHICK